MAIYPDRVCRECGRLFEGGPRAWYCPGCRAERTKKANREFKQRERMGNVRKIGSKDLCVVCGKKYTVDGGLQKYCPECAPAAIGAIALKQTVEWYEAHKDTYNPDRNSKRHTKRTCVICGKEFPSDGVSSVTCSDVCHKIRRKDQQKTADQKRLPRNKKSRSSQKS